MQTATIEFVAFDAQDVIATSGLATACFTLSKTLVSGATSLSIEGRWAVFRQDIPGGSYKELGKIAFYLSDSGIMTPVEGTVYMLTQGDSGMDKGERKPPEAHVFAPQVISNTSLADETLSSLAEIGAWINQYCVSPW